MNIKPIETIYNGYRFRSRLEARWAVFFDAAGIKYQYEPEGFEIKGIRYLPDFYLPELDTHIEVKADTVDAIPDVERCYKMITWGGPIKRIVFLSDVPGDCDGGMWHFPALYWCDDRVTTGWYFFHDDGDNSCMGQVSSASYRRPFSFTHEGNIFIPSYKTITNAFSLSAISDMILDLRRLPADWKSYQLLANEKTFAAFKKARQARFEFGETPK